MSDYHSMLLRFLGRVDNTDEFKARSYPHDDSKSTLLVISNWQSVPECHRATVVQFVVSDERGPLEWTFSAERRRLPSPVQLLLPVTPSAPRLVVKMKVLTEDVTNRRTAATAAAAAGDTKCYENLHEVSCQVEHLNLSGTSTTDVFKDFRPRLRENVGIGSGAKMAVLAAFDSVLPVADSLSFDYDGHKNTLPIIFYEGKDKDVYCRRRLFQVSLSLQPSVTSSRTITVNFDFAQDGTLAAVISEGSRNVEQCCSPQILDVIGRKLTTNVTEPTLTIAELRGNQVRLRMNTTYGQSEIEMWQITLTPRSRSAGTNSKSSIFLVPVTDFEQSFHVPMETVTAGTQYGIKVDGLQACDSGTTDGAAAFKVVCSNSTAATLNARAKLSNLDILLRLRDLQLTERIPGIPISASTLGPQVARAITVVSRSIKIERSTFHQATVVITDDNARYSNNDAWKITIKRISTATAPVAYSLPREFSVQATGRTEQRYEFPLQFQPGHTYEVQVEGSDLLNQTTTFRAELTIDDIRRLHSMAKRHTAGHGSSPCSVLYRNKSYEYFEDIMENEGGIMRVYDKDNSGDPASPINLQIKGLFFMATVERGTLGEPLRQSAFGPVRVRIQAEEMLRKAPNLYFVDYYCMRGQNHYVTLVMTKPGSATDLFCQPRLLKLDINDSNDNPFFFRDTYGQLQVSTGYFLQIELLFTEDLDIRGYPRTHTPTVGKGSSTKGGIPKNPSCRQCNLGRGTGFPAF